MLGSAARRGFAVIYFATLCFLVARSEPPWAATLQAPFPINPEPLFYGEAAGRPEALYRIDASRTGFLDQLSPHADHARLLVPDWNLGIHTASKSSPVGAGELIYVGSDAGKLGAFSLDGRKRWEYIVTRASHGIHSTPAVGGNYVCVGTYHGYISCLHRADGRPLWFRRVGDAVGSSPLVHGGVIFASVETTGRPEGYEVALRLSDGKLIWRSPYFGNQSHSSPTLAPAERLLMVGDNKNFLNALRLDDGSVAWRADLGGEVKSTAMVHGGRVFATSRAGWLFALEAATGKIVWKQALGGTSQSSPTLLAGGERILVSASGGGLRVYRAADGELLAAHAWRGDDRDARMPSALALSDAVWIACGSRLLCKLSADGARVLKEFPLGGFASGMPWWQNGSIFVSTGDGGGIYRVGG
jgi:outer membrane protein assembly factor BamB